MVMPIELVHPIKEFGWRKPPLALLTPYSIANFPYLVLEITQPSKQIVYKC